MEIELLKALIIMVIETETKTECPVLSADCIIMGASVLLVVKNVINAED